MKFPIDVALLKMILREQNDLKHASGAVFGLNGPEQTKQSMAQMPALSSLTA